MPSVESVTNDGLAQITMNRPESHNSMTAEMAHEMKGSIENAAADDAIRAITLTGSEGTFNTGADLTTLDGTPDDAERLDEIARGLHGAVRAIVGAPIPVVVGVNGVVAGGGLGLALAGDVVLVSDEARFEYAYPAIGLSGDGGATWLLPRLVGWRTAQSLMLRDESVPAGEAVELGLATEVVPAAALSDRITETARTLADGPTRAYGEIKTLLREGASRDLDPHLADERRRLTNLTETADYRRGLTAFLEGEEPTFEGC